MKDLAKIFVVFSVSVIMLVSCDAPRNNPLDPQNPRNLYHTVTGQVKSISIPYQPLSEVSIIWPELSLSTLTNGDGHFLLETIRPANTYLYFHKSGFVTDSVPMTWQDQKSIEMEVFLNAIPRLDSAQVYSIILNRYPDLQTEQVGIWARISDPDDDLDSVLVHNEYLAKNFQLEYHVTDKWYGRTLGPGELNVDNIDMMVGRPFNFIVTDLFEHRFELDQLAVQRIIRDMINHISPSGGESVSAQPVLHWQQFYPGFEFTITLQIYTSEIGSQLVWEQSGLADTTTFFEVDQPLPPNEYYWVAWAIDDFGNRSRSKPASFLVE